MIPDFFEATQDSVRELNQNERILFDFVVKNMDMVKSMSIRKFAELRFVSTTTIFRFVKKLGFSGYTDFTDSLIVTAHSANGVEIPSVITGEGYSGEYLRNAMESLRVMSPKQVKSVVKLLKKKPSIYILTDDNTQAIGQYCERLFIGLDFHAYFPEAVYQRQSLVNSIKSSDLLIALSYSGQDTVLIDFIQRLFLKEHPHLLSITRADNNPLERLSDTNFYVFADKIRVPGMDLTSNVPMLMVIEMIVYEYLASKEGK
ncbi:MAG: MurR/RpiR family transcriptional regulator [Oscillospiraceae bacterium]|nr:MurR/RpiR family transcriptional regulator [Oscillospiraceae bacterium]